MTSEHNHKSSFSTGRNRAGSINTPHFAPQAVQRGHSSTAERHTMPAPDLISSQNSADELGNNVPGSYPQEDMPWVSQMLKKHHDVDNPKHLGTLKVDLPLEEQPGGAREGVGSLPGPNAESGVAILPDERHPDRLQEVTEDSPLPSKEHPSGSRVGVGSLPGKNSEAGVATLPEERINGRPFGQGHTGFEKTLGNERTHIDVDTPATRSGKGQHAPKETIFSATQREMQRDPDFLAHRGAFFQHPHQTNLPSAEGVRTFVQGAAGAMYMGAEGLLHGAQGAVQSFEERFKGQDPIQATKDMIQSLEARLGAKDALQRGKEQVRGLEGHIGAGAGGAVQGAMGVIHNLEARFAHNPIAMEGSSADVANRDFTAARDSSGDEQTGTDATHSETPPSRNPNPLTSTRKDSPQVPGVSSALPETLQQQYLRNGDRGLSEGNLVREKHDTSKLADDGDKSARASISGDDGGEKMPTNDDRDVPSIGGGDMARGAMGVQYHAQAQGVILPGYPTPEGMAMLINDRLQHDQARNTAASGGDTASLLSGTSDRRSSRACLPRDGAAASSEDARGPYSTELRPLTPDSPVDGRVIEEPREIPVFEGGSICADGKYEAVFRPTSDLRDDAAASAEAVRGSYSSEFLPSTSYSPGEGRIIEEPREIPVFEGGSIHADGKHEPVFRPASGYPEELVASSALHQAQQHHDLHRPSRSSETNDLSRQFSRKHSSSSLEDERHAFDEQVSLADNPNEVTERPGFFGQSGDTAAGKYDAAYHLADMPSVEIPSTDMPAVGMPPLTSRSLDPDAERFRNEQLVKTDHPNEIEGRPDFRGQSAGTAFGKYEATYHPAGMPPRPFVADDKELRNEQLVKTDHLNKIDQRSDFAAGKHEAIHQPPPPNLPQLSSRFGSEQVVKTNHPNEIDERPTFVDRASETAAGKYEATFHLAGMRPDQVPISHSRRQPAPTEGQVASMNNPNEIEEWPIFTGKSEAAKGLNEVVDAPIGAPLDTGLKKEVPTYLGKPLSGKQPGQEQRVPKKKPLN